MSNFGPVFFYYPITSNNHHPEYWNNDVADEDLLNTKDRDGIPDKIIDATDMPGDYIYEMVADWCAMSEEKGNTPKQWADMVVGKRWKFNKIQTDLIYEIIDKVWED